MWSSGWISGLRGLLHVSTRQSTPEYAVPGFVHIIHKSNEVSMLEQHQTPMDNFASWDPAPAAATTSHGGRAQDNANDRYFSHAYRLPFGRKDRGVSSQGPSQGIATFIESKQTFKLR